MQSARKRARLISMVAAATAMAAVSALARPAIPGPTSPAVLRIGQPAPTGHRPRDIPVLSTTPPTSFTTHQRLSISRSVRRHWPSVGCVLAHRPTLPSAALACCTLIQAMTLRQPPAGSECTVRASIPSATPFAIGGISAGTTQISAIVEGTNSINFSGGITVYANTSGTETLTRRLANRLTGGAAISLGDVALSQTGAVEGSNLWLDTYAGKYFLNGIVSDGPGGSGNIMLATTESPDSTMPLTRLSS